MKEKASDLASALVEVRRAYRLLQAYHRRLNDLLDTTHQCLAKQGLELERWYPLGFARPPNRSKPSFTSDRWAWDLMPGYMVACVWEGGRKSTHYKIDIHAITDTAYDASREGEPDPSGFDPPETSRSELRLGLYRTRTKKPSWGDAWRLLSALPNRQNGDIHRVKVGDHEYEHRYFDIDLAELRDEHAVKEKLLRPLEQWIETP